MKKIDISLIAASLVLVASSANADSLHEALQNGKFNGDVALRYEQRMVDKESKDGYYRDSGYVVGSIGMNYQTGSFYNFSAKVGMRAYAPLWENDDDSTTWKGKGDASERYYDTADHVMLSTAYIAYDAKNIAIKAGRQGFYTEWVGKIHDAVSAYITPMENSQIELIWTKRVGRVYDIEHRDFTDTNDNNGVYKAGYSHKLNDNFKAKVYYLDAPDKFNLFGGNINLDMKIGEGNIGLYLHAMQTNEDVQNTKDGELFETKLYGNYAGYNLTLGYVKTGEENGWGSANTAGETVVPFEEGDGMYTPDATTWYAMLYKNFAGVDLTLLYGQVESQNYSGADKLYTDKELDIWAGYNVTKNLKLNAGLAFINAEEGSASFTDLTQVNTTFIYSF